MTGQALGFAPGWVAGLESYRVNNYIAASLHYLVLGRVATEIGTVYAEMSRRKRGGEPDWFERSGAGRYFRARGHELYLEDDFYYGHTPNLLEDDLRISFRGRVQGRSLDIPVDAAMLGWFGRLLPRLRRTVPIEQVRAVCDDEEWTFVEQLIAEGLLCVTDLAPVPAHDGYSLRLLGHAGLDLQTPQVRVLFDPLCIVRTRDDVDLLHELDRPIDAVVISHPHWDHFNLDTLLHIPRQTRMIVPRVSHPPSLENLDMAPLLEQLGFTRIERLALWDSVDVGDVHLTATPFHGEHSGPEVEHDWMTYDVRAGGRAFFGAVDSCQSSHGSMDHVMRDVRTRLGKVDILFAPYSGFHYPISMFTRRPFYMGPGMEQYSGGPDDAVRWVSILDADLLVPYAGFVWGAADYDRSNDPTHRGSLRQLRSIVKSYPAGPLLVLEPRAGAFTWPGPGGELCVPPVTSAIGASR